MIRPAPLVLVGVAAAAGVGHTGWVDTGTDIGD